MDNTSKNSGLRQDFPAVNQDGRTAIVCHRGWWKCEAGGMSENSLASLKAAQGGGFWGSECDVHITSDGVIIVNHNDDIAGKRINEYAFADFSGDLLPNGERRPTLDEYLLQTSLCPGCRLVIELKIQSSTKLEDRLLEGTVEALKKRGLYDAQKVGFISFSRHICCRIAKEHPSFLNQFLTDDDLPQNTPDSVAADGINGIDYHHKLFSSHPEWVSRAHSLGMSVNVWTVNKEDKIKEMASLGVDAITTNEPALTREILGANEFSAISH